MPRKSSRAFDVHPAGCGQDLPPPPPTDDAQRGAGTPARPRRREGEDRREGNENEEREPGASEQMDETPGAGRDGGAEEVGRSRPEHTARRHRVAPVPPALRPLDRMGPLRLEIRPGRAVEERPLELAPASLERDPGKRPLGCPGVARNGLHDGSEGDVRPARVVAPDPCLGGASEVEGLRVLVRMRPGGRVDDRMRSIDERELVVVPGRPFGPFVRAVADLDRLLRERRARIERVEDELDHLPVALVQVVEVVEDVEEPVLQGELSGIAGVGGDVRVDGRLLPLRDQPRPALVVTAG